MKDDKLEQYYMAMYQIIAAGHWITDEISRALKEFNMTEPQYNVLRTLKENKERPLTVQEIQEGMVQRSSNVTRIIDKLITKGFVTRQECATNRRKMDINITPEGLEYLKKLDVKVREFHTPLMERITEEDAQQILKLVKKLRGV